MQRAHTTSQHPNSESVYSLKDNVRIGPVLHAKTTNLSGPHSIEVLIPSKQNLQTCSCVLIDLEQFIAEDAERIPSCEKDSHSQARPCASNEQTDQHPHSEMTHSHGTPYANPDSAQPPGDQRKQAILDKATIPVTAALSQRGPPVIPMDKRLDRCSDFTEIRYHGLKRLSNNAQKILRREHRLRKKMEQYIGQN